MANAHNEKGSSHGKESWWSRAWEATGWFVDKLKYGLAAVGLYSLRPEFFVAAGGSWFMEKILFAKKAH